MTAKEKKLKAILELVGVSNRIDELKRSKTYLFGSSAYYRNRLSTLEDKAEKLQDIIDGKETEEIKFVLHVPESLIKEKSVKEPEDFVQFFKREFLFVE